MSVPHDAAAVRKLDRELRNHGQSFFVAGWQSQPVAEHKLAMNTICGGRVCCREIPIGEDRVDDLETGRHPVDALEEIIDRHTGCRCRTEMQHERRLDLRL